jgi:hypothetical protein
VTKHIGSALPDDVQRALNGDGLSPMGTTASITVTSDPDGMARICMLGAGEILAIGERRVRLALWSTSRSLDNLRRGSELVLCVIVPPAPFYVRARPIQLWIVDDEVTAVEATVESVVSDSHKGFRVVSGVQVEAEKALAADLYERSLEILAALRSGPSPGHDEVS